MTTLYVRPVRAGKGTRYVCERKAWSLIGYATFPSAEGAIANAERKRDERVSLLERQITQLRALTFKVEE